MTKSIWKEKIRDCFWCNDDQVLTEKLDKVIDDLISESDRLKQENEIAIKALSSIAIEYGIYSAEEALSQIERLKKE